MKFAQHFVGAQFVTATLNNTSPLVDAFVFEKSGKLELALINKSDVPFACSLPAGALAKPTLRLSGPAIDAKNDVRLSPVHFGHYAEVAAAEPYSAMAFELKGVISARQETKE